MHGCENLPIIVNIMTRENPKPLMWAVAPPADNEDERLDEIVRLGLADPVLSDGLGDFPELARAVTGYNIALVSIVTDEKQCFHAVSGEFESTSTPREISFCQFSILGDSVFEVPDTLVDPRFKKNPLVTGEPNIRSYAGAPLITSRGFALGSLCVIDDSPKTLSADQRDQLMRLAGLLVREIESRGRANGERILRLELGRTKEALQRSFDTEREALLDRLEESNRYSQLGQSVVEVAHDMRDPLTTIHAGADVMKLQFIEMNALGIAIPDEVAERFVAWLDVTESIHSAAERLKGLSEALMRSGREAERVEKVSVRSLFTQIESSHRAKLDGVEIVHQVSDIVWFGQAEPVLRVLSNLVSNACDATEEQEERKIAFRATFEGEWLKLAVADSGMGLDPSIAEAVFRKGFSTKSVLRGSGLGLSICKELVERLGGRIAAGPDEDLGGANFSIWLPR